MTNLDNMKNTLSSEILNLTSSSYTIYFSSWRESLMFLKDLV